jgi:dihydrofolate reductase
MLLLLHRAPAAAAAAVWHVLQVYKEAVDSDRCSVIHLTRVEAEPECDTFFPDITASGGLAGQSHHHSFTNCTTLRYMVLTVLGTMHHSTVLCAPSGVRLHA